MITDETKQKLAVRTLTLQERIERGSRCPNRYISELPEDLNQKWQDVVAGADADQFARRLELSNGASKRQPMSILATWPAEEATPDWIEWLSDLLRWLDTCEQIWRREDAEDEIPFSHFLGLIVDFAIQQCDWSNLSLSLRARERFERFLLGRLESLYSQTLFIEFKTFVATNDLNGEADAYNYHSFIRHLLDKKLTDFFTEYAVLSRLTILIIRQWIEMVEEFDTRLSKDRFEICEVFNDGAAIGNIENVEFLGDSHHGGRRVLELDFASGPKLVYKPRSIAADGGFFDLLEWFNQITDLPDLKSLDYLSRSSHGWVEWVEAEPCESKEQVQEYFVRSGTLSCLLYVLMFTDGNIENVIAAGDQPVVVDLETVGSGQLPSGRSLLYSNLESRARDSVLWTGLLPMHTPSGDGSGLSGFGEPSGEMTGVEVPKFTNINMDEMELEFQATSEIEGRGLPEFEGERISPGDYSDEFIRGFETTYRWLLDERDVFLNEGIGSRFDDVEARILYRTTQTYQKIIAPLMTPQYLRDGFQFGCKAEMMSRPFVTGHIGEEMWPMYMAERASTWRLDVPRFTVNTSERTIYHGTDVVVTDAFDTSSVEQLHDRVSNLSHQDLVRQLSYLRLAYAPRTLDECYGEPSVTNREPRIESGQNERDWGTYPYLIFDRLESAATRDSGTLTWNVRESRGGGVFVHEIFKDFYEGRIGTAVFCGALAKVSDDERYRSFAVDLTDPLIKEFEETGTFNLNRNGIGHGIGSLIYGFTKLSDLLGHDRYSNIAVKIASSIDNARIGSDTALDVLNGNAGLVLALLSLFESTGDKATLRTAEVAGERLLTERTEMNGVPVWETIGGQAICGMSHGVSGIAYALYRLYGTSGNEQFRDAAVESLPFEDKRYDAKRHNWPDMRARTDDAFVPGWCGGRAGVGLARTGMFEVDQRQVFAEEAKRALAGTDPEEVTEFDYICCGDFGRVEFLTRAGRTFENPEYGRKANRLAENIVRRAERRGYFNVPWQTHKWYNPSLFFGEPGIGYTLLRLENPDLPSVLLFE